MKKKMLISTKANGWLVLNLLKADKSGKIQTMHIIS